MTCSLQQVPGSPFQNPPPMQLMQTWSIDVHASSSVSTPSGHFQNELCLYNNTSVSIIMQCLYVIIFA